MQELVFKLKVYVFYYLEYIGSTTIAKIVKSRLTKPKKDKEIERKRAICLGCSFNSNNSRKKLSYKFFLILLSDFYSWFTGNSKVDNLGNCTICGCSTFYSTIYENEHYCKHPNGSQWKRVNLKNN